MKGIPVLNPADFPPGLVAVPVGSWLYADAMVAIGQLQVPPGSGKYFERGATFPDGKRNECIRMMLGRPAFEWVFFCDSDHAPASDTLLRLLATGCEVVGGLYVGRARGEQVVPPLYVPECGADVQRAMAGELQVCDWVGAGALLVRRRVLEKVGAPWFFRPENWDEDEDIAFCRKVRKAGFQVHVDGRVQVPHLQVVPLTVAAVA